MTEIDPKYIATMNDLADAIDELFNGKNGDKEVGFALLVWKFDGPEGYRCNYIANTKDRNGIITMMKEVIARWEGQPEMSGKA